MSDEGYYSDISENELEVVEEDIVEEAEVELDFTCLQYKYVLVLGDDEIRKKCCRHCAREFDGALYYIRRHFTVISVRPSDLIKCYNCDVPLYTVNRGQDCDSCALFIGDFY